MDKIILIIPKLIFIMSLCACGEFNSSIGKNSEINFEDNNTSSETEDSIQDELVEEFLWPEFDWDNKNISYLNWNQYTFNSIKDVGLNLVSKRPSDIISFCPKYDQLNSTGKKLFWISLFAAMARFESSFNPDATFVESFKDAKGQNVISRGLLQLSIESSLGYRCPLANAQDLHRADKNLDCAVRIMDRWIDRDGVITAQVSGSWRGGARYWSVLRKDNTLNSIREKTRTNEVCK